MARVHLRIYGAACIQFSVRREFEISCGGAGFGPGSAPSIAIVSTDAGEFRNGALDENPIEREITEAVFDYYRRAPVPVQLT